MKVFKFAFCLMIALVFTGGSFAQDGVTDTEIILGQSCALEGAAASLGKGMRAGLLAAFDEVNEAGGVNGKKIKLISKDDSYEPEKAIKNTTELIEQDKVFLLIGEVGTPTSKAVLPIAEIASVPFFGPFTGAGFLRDPSKKVINVRGSYFQEMERLAEYLVDKNKFTKIACFYQNDGYGQVGLEGIKEALKKRNMELVGTGSYERNTTNIKGALSKIRKAKPQAVVMVGAYKPCAEFIKMSKKYGMKDTVFCNISFVGTEALLAELGDQGEGVVISQVVKYPWDESVPLVKDFQAAMKKYQPDATAGFVALEGYMVGKLFAAAAAKVEGDLTRESFMKAVEGTDAFDLGGVILKYSEQDHQGMDEVFLTIIKGDKVVPLDE